MLTAKLKYIISKVLCSDGVTDKKSHTIRANTVDIYDNVTEENQNTYREKKTFLKILYYSFSGKTKHLVLNRSAEEADLMRVRTHQAMLNLVSQDVFPILPAASGSSTSELKDFSEENIVFACSGLHYVYRGKDLGFQW